MALIQVYNGSNTGTQRLRYGCYMQRGKENSDWGSIKH